MTMTAIGETYNGKQLQLVKKNENAAGLSWARYPVQVTSTELSTIKNQTALTSVLADTFKTPSQAAGIPSHKIICPVIHLIDAEFRKARKEYQEKLALAEGEDLKKIRKMEQDHNVKNYGGLFGWIFKILEAFGANYKSEKEVAREGSAHRIRWIYEIDNGESERIKKIRTEVKKAMSAVVADIESRAKTKVVDMDIFRKARQLSALYKAIFPDENNDDVKKMNGAIASLPATITALL